MLQHSNIVQHSTTCCNIVQHVAPRAPGPAASAESPMGEVVRPLDSRGTNRAGKGTKHADKGTNHALSTRVRLYVPSPSCSGAEPKLSLQQSSGPSHRKPLSRPRRCERTQLERTHARTDERMHAQGKLRSGHRKGTLRRCAPAVAARLGVCRQPWRHLPRTRPRTRHRRYASGLCPRYLSGARSQCRSSDRPCRASTRRG